jgi:flagellar basal-body rod modification protein FlgD
MTPFGAVQSSISNAVPPATTPASPTTGSTSDLGNQQTFLQLLVAQLKYQDPLAPQDGTAFVTQLAQFSDLEQQIGTHSDLDAIRQLLAATAAPVAPVAPVAPAPTSPVTTTTPPV